MKKIAKWIIFVATLPSCAPVVKFVLLPSHAERIQQVVMKDAEELVKSPWIIKGKTYEIINLEAGESAQDDPLNALIRDTFTKGYK